MRFVIKGKMAERFKQSQNNVNVISAKEDLNRCKDILKEDLGVYECYLKKDARILAMGYGLGTTSTPLSILGCDVVGVDHDKKIIGKAAKGGNKFGKGTEFALTNIFYIDKLFRKDSFHVCISRGILEHLSRDRVRDIIDKQLFLAPVVIACFPVRTKRTLRYYNVKHACGKEVCCDKVHRNLWSEYQWTEDILEFYEIEESCIKKCSPSMGGYDEMFVVIERDCTGEEFNGLVDEPDKEVRMAELLEESYGWNEELAAFELYLMNCLDFPFKANFRSKEYGDRRKIFTVLRITCCRHKSGVFCEIRFDDGVRREVPVYSIIPLDKGHKRNIALDDYIEWLAFNAS